MRQKKFTFSKYFTDTVLKSIDTPPLTETQFKKQLVEQGYLVKDVRRVETVTYTAICARANIALEERKKLQKTYEAH